MSTIRHWGRRQAVVRGMSQYITQSHPDFTTGNKIIGCQIAFQKGQCNLARRGYKNVLTRTEKAYTLVKCISILFIFFIPLWQWRRHGDQSESYHIDSVPAYSVTSFCVCFFMIDFIPDGLLITLTIKVSGRTALPLIPLYLPLYLMYPLMDKYYTSDQKTKSRTR